MYDFVSSGDLRRSRNPQIRGYARVHGGTIESRSHRGGQGFKPLSSTKRPYETSGLGRRQVQGRLFAAHARVPACRGGHRAATSRESRSSKGWL